MRRCDGILRREFLRVGGLSALGLGLADALRRRARAEAPRTALKNCILVWLDGGPSHLETFDLKPDAPAEVRGPYRPIATNVPGLAIGEHFGRLARVMDRACVIRSMTSELGEHNFGRHYLLTGYKPSPVLEYPSFGSVVARSRDRASGLPSYVAVPDASPQAGPGYLPAEFGPFAVGGDPSRPDFRVRDLESAPELAGRLDRRRRFLADFDRFERRVEQDAARAGATPTSSRPTGSSPRPRRRAPSTCRASRPPCASVTGCTAWGSPACWPAGWSRPAARSSP